MTRMLRLAGRLDSIHATGEFTLVLGNGIRVSGSGAPLDELRDGFARQVLVEGRASLGPSDEVSHIDADWIEPASETDVAVFGVRPAREAEPRGGLAAMLGQWPGDESLEELLAQLEALK
ncbi:MAG: hypothetical protein GQE15_11920 [Archangiaceae bacterium]|nr:hypothetical protein [Archangiaceae bacterium]